MDERAGLPSGKPRVILAPIPSWRIRINQNPIRFFFGSIGCSNFEMRNRISCNSCSWAAKPLARRLSISCSRFFKSPCSWITSLMRIKARTIKILASIATGLFRTFAAITAPCSVKAYGRYFACCPRPFSKVAFCDLRELTS